MKKKIVITLTILLFFIISIVRLFFVEKEIKIVGKTMGTTYNIRVLTNFFVCERNLKSVVDCCLNEVNCRFSTYDDNSEVSFFNSILKIEELYYSSSYFLDLMCISKKLNKLVNGLWDPTIYPLVDFWGFNKKKKYEVFFKKNVLDDLLNKVDFNNAIFIGEDDYIKKCFSKVSLDFASIAKGYGVDQVVLLLELKGFKNFTVEIGGEVYVKGLNRLNKCWRVGIKYPSREIMNNDIYKILSLTNMALATSGNYCNYLKINGEFYSHIIDPRTGYPVTNDINSVSVIAESCTIADGLATALMVFEVNEALEFINALSNIECIIIVVNGKRDLKNYYSEGVQ